MKNKERRGSFVKRLIVAISLILAALFLFNACAQSEKPETPTAAPTENSQPAAEPTDTEPTATEPAVTEPAVTEATETEPIIPDPEPDWFAEAVSFSDLPTSKTAVRYGDWRMGVPTGDEPIKALVIYISFTDGHTIDKALFEDRFNGEYDYDNCIRSLASYYHYNSYGKVKFDFTFIYYESSMTCEEAWHYINDEDENGHFYGNEFLYDIFNEIKAENEAGIDYKSLDGDGDGFIDITYFITGEDLSKTKPGETGYWLYGPAYSATNYSDYGPNAEDPTLKHFVKANYEGLSQEPDSGQIGESGIRAVLHETGHALGLDDYYDTAATEKLPVLQTLGGFDMMERDVGDHNAFSKFALGYIEPYVVDGIEDEITIRMSVSEDHDDVILIPTSKGWNGTAFDEYILVDVFAPVGATGFDWGRYMYIYDNPQGGVRILHVDARLSHYEENEETGEYENVFLDDPNDAVKYEGVNVNHAFYNSLNQSIVINGEKQSIYYHLVEIVPSDKDNTSYRKGTGIDTIKVFNTQNLFGPGQTFSTQYNMAFTNVPRMNNGGTLDYSVTVRAYDEITHEAVITIKRINTEN